jgi:hypothetical protein
MLGGGGWGHSFQSPGALFEDYGDPHIAWRPGTCGGYHTACEEYDDALEELDALEFAIAVGDAETVASALERYPHVLHYNESRMAIQFTNCGGEIAAHLPVSDALSSALLR